MEPKNKPKVRPGFLLILYLFFSFFISLSFTKPISSYMAQHPTALFSIVVEGIGEMAGGHYWRSPVHREPSAQEKNHMGLFLVSYLPLAVFGLLIYKLANTKNKRN